MQTKYTMFNETFSGNDLQKNCRREDVCSLQQHENICLQQLFRD